MKADRSLTLGAAQEEAQTTDHPSHSAGNPLCVPSFHLVSVQTGSKIEVFLKASSKLGPAKLAMAPSCPGRARPLLNSLLQEVQNLFPWNTKVIYLGARILLPWELQGPRTFIMHLRPLTWPQLRCSGRTPQNPAVVPLSSMLDWVDAPFPQG